MASRFTRRNFLGSAAGIAGLSAAGVPGAAAAVNPEPWGIKLGVCTYSVRSFDRAKAIEMIKTLETPWISIKDVHLKQDQPAAAIEAGAKEFRDAGLRIMSGGNVSMNETDLAGLRKHFEYAKAAGMPMMVCAPLHENLHLIEQLVKEYNIRIAIHNHGPEDKNFPTPQSVLEAVRNLDPRCGLCIDVGHTARTGVDVVESIVLARAAAARYARQGSGRFQEQGQPGGVRRRPHAFPPDLQTAEEDAIPGLRKPGVRDSR